MSTSLTCFQWLSKTRNLSALDLLSNLLDSPIESVRRDAAFNLSDRPEKVASEILIRKLGTLGRTSAAAWKNIAFRLVPSVLEILADDRNELFEAALKTSAACEISEALPALVATAERFGSPHGLTAGKLLLELAISCSKRAVESGQMSEVREKLIQLLFQSVENFPLHRNRAILDAFLACSIPDDAHIHRLLNNTQQPTFKLLSRHWKTTQCIEAIDLLVHTLWKHYLSNDVQAILFQNRKDRLLAKSFAKCMNRELSDHVIDRLNRYGTPACCLSIHPSDQELPLEDRLNLWRLLAITNGPFERFVAGIQYFLSAHRDRCEISVADMLKLYSPPSHLEVMTAIGLDDDVFHLDSIPNKSHEDESNSVSDEAVDSSQYRPVTTLESILYLVEQHPNFPDPLKDAVEYFLMDFHCANLIDKLNAKSDDYIGTFAKIVAVAEKDWEESLKSCMKSPVPAVRCKAVVAATYFPLSAKLRPTIQELLEDPKEVIREEAAFALGRYNSIASAPSDALHTESDLGISLSLNGLTDKELAYGMG